MDSFRTELENPVVAKDIIELENKIYAFKLQSLNDIALSYPLKSGNMYIIRVITTKKAETFKIVA